ncbi:hypothetical protein Clacol_002137 [Clathrus columnatus]|uniref:Uncharacterized protein n=1 Tax=Clathrus columnatus TaxID=1419009 RepID=A0AAV5A7P8_9AGAM|nr:hypothetical protein Clacol_002137 [Clathrus columnatus]
MLSSSESDPFTTAPPSALGVGPSASAAATVIHGFPKERHSFRNVDRVRQRFKTSKGFHHHHHHHQQDEDENMNNGAGGIKRKFKGKSTSTMMNASLRSSGGSGSVTESAHISASTVPSRIQMWEDEEDEEERRRKKKKQDDDSELVNTETLSRYALKTAQQMESASVGRTMIPSSPTTTGRRDLSKPRGEKLHRRRTFAGYTHTMTEAQQKNLPHIDLVSKLPRSSSASPALIRAPVPAPAPGVAFQKRKSVTVSSSKDNISKTLVLHRLSRKRRGVEESSSFGHSPSRRSSLLHSISQTLPNKTLGGGPITTTANDAPGISITELSARSLELLIENGLILVFKKLEVNHGFSNDTVKRAWFRCNGDIEATDHLLLTMRKAAEKAEASFLGDEYLVAEEESESEDEEEEKKRNVKRPRWSEPHISSYSSPITVRSIESIDSRYAPHLSSDREFTIYPMEKEEEEEYTPPVGTKAEMFRRLTDQGRHEDARKILIIKSSSSRKSISSNPTPVRKGVVEKAVNESLSGGRISLKKHETTTPSSSSRKIVSGKVVEDTTTTRETRPIQNDPSSSSFSSPTKKAYGKVADRPTTVTASPPLSPTETTPTIGRLIGSSTKSPNPSITREPIIQHTPIHQHDDDDDQISSRGKQTTTPLSANTNNKNIQTENPASSTMKSNSSRNNDTNWTLSDEEMLANSLLGKSQLEKLSVKYGEQNVLKRFLKVVKARG